MVVKHVSIYMRKTTSYTIINVINTVENDFYQL